MQDRTTLKTIRRHVGIHPGWCEGGDHLDVCKAVGIDPTEAEHYATVAEDAGWEVYVKQPAVIQPGRGGPVITLSAPSTEHHRVQVELTSARARSVAAWLLAAADRVEMMP